MTPEAERIQRAGLLMSATLGLVALSMLIFYLGNEALTNLAANNEYPYGYLAQVSINQLGNALFGIAWIAQFLGLALFCWHLLTFKANWSARIALVLAAIATLFGLTEIVGISIRGIVIAVFDILDMPFSNRLSIPVQWFIVFRQFYLVLYMLMLIFLGNAMRFSKGITAWLWILTMAWGFFWMLSSIRGNTNTLVMFFVPIVIGLYLLRQAFKGNPDPSP